MYVHCTDSSRRICEETASVLRREGQSAEAVAVTFLDNLISGWLPLPAATPLLTDDEFCVVVL